MFDILAGAIQIVNEKVVPILTSSHEMSLFTSSNEVIQPLSNLVLSSIAVDPSIFEQMLQQRLRHIGRVQKEKLMGMISALMQKRSIDIQSLDRSSRQLFADNFKEFAFELKSMELQ